VLPSGYCCILYTVLLCASEKNIIIRSIGLTLGEEGDFKSKIFKAFFSMDSAHQWRLTEQREDLGRIV
jgi:hypothetical protein